MTGGRPHRGLYAREGVAEAAVGLEYGVHAGIDCRRALVQRLHSRPGATRPLVSLKRHAEAALEGASHLHRIEPAHAQVVIPEPQARMLFDLLEERQFQTRWRHSARLEDR